MDLKDFFNLHINLVVSQPVNLMHLHALLTLAFGRSHMLSMLSFIAIVLYTYMYINKVLFILTFSVYFYTFSQTCIEFWIMNTDFEHFNLRYTTLRTWTDGKIRMCINMEKQNVCRVFWKVNSHERHFFTWPKIVRQVNELYIS